jgi:hypothetical protein
MKVIDIESETNKVKEQRKNKNNKKHNEEIQFIFLRNKVNEFREITKLL